MYMKNILLIGLGRFGKHVALQLNQLGHEVMAVDANEERVNKVLPFVTNAQIGDSTNAEFLKSLVLAIMIFASWPLEEIFRIPWKLLHF